MQLHVAASVQRVGIGPYGRVLYQSIFCESTGTRRSLAASPRLLKAYFVNLHRPPMFGPCPGRQQPAALTPGSPLVRLCPRGCPRRRPPRKTNPDGWQVARISACAALRFRAGLCLHRLSVDDPNRAAAWHDRLEPRQPRLPKRATRQRYRETLTSGLSPSNLEPTMTNYRTPQVTPLVNAAGCYSKNNTVGFRL